MIYYPAFSSISHLCHARRLSLDALLLFTSSTERTQCQVRLARTVATRMATTQSVVLAERPTGDLQPGKTFRMQPQKKLSEDDLKDGQALVETIYLSLDPAMRGWLNDTRSYVPPVQVGAVMRGAVIARVVASKSSKYEVGCHIYALCGWREQAIVEDKDGDVQKLDVPKGGRLTDALGVLGMLVYVIITARDMLCNREHELISWNVLGMTGLVSIFPGHPPMRINLHFSQLCPGES